MPFYKASDRCMTIHKTLTSWVKRMLESLPHTDRFGSLVHHNTVVYPIDYPKVKHRLESAFFHPEYGKMNSTLSYWVVDDGDRSYLREAQFVRLVYAIGLAFFMLGLFLRYSDTRKEVVKKTWARLKEWYRWKFTERRQNLPL